MSDSLLTRVRYYAALHSHWPQISETSLLALVPTTIDYDDGLELSSPVQRAPSVEKLVSHEPMPKEEVDVPVSVTGPSDSASANQSIPTTEASQKVENIEENTLNASVPEVVVKPKSHEELEQPLSLPLRHVYYYSRGVRHGFEHVDPSKFAVPLPIADVRVAKDLAHDILLPRSSTTSLNLAGHLRAPSNDSSAPLISPKPHDNKKDDKKGGKGFMGLFAKRDEKRDAIASTSGTTSTANLSKKEEKERRKREEEEEKARREQLERERHAEKERERHAEKERAREEKERLERERREAEKERIREEKERVERAREAEKERIREEKEKAERARDEKERLERERREAKEREKEREKERQRERERERAAEKEKEKEKERLAVAVFTVTTPSGDKRTLPLTSSTTLREALLKALRAKDDSVLDSLKVSDGEGGAVLDLEVALPKVPGRAVTLAWRNVPIGGEVLDITPANKGKDKAKLAKEAKEKEKEKGAKDQEKAKDTKEGKAEEKKDKALSPREPPKAKKTREELKRERELRKDERQRKLIESQGGESQEGAPKLEENSAEALPLPSGAPARPARPTPTLVVEETETLSLDMPARPVASLEGEPHQEPSSGAVVENESTTEDLPAPKPDQPSQVEQDWRELARAGNKAYHVLAASTDGVNAVHLTRAVERVRTLARDNADTRAVGWTDVIRDALRAGVSEALGDAAIRALQRWRFKLQLAYIRFVWGWQSAYKFKVNSCLRHARLSVKDYPLLIEDLESLQLKFTTDTTGATAWDASMKHHGKTRLTRARSRGENIRLDYNYYRTPLPLCPEALDDPSIVREDTLLHGYEWSGWWPAAVSSDDLSPVVLDCGGRYTKFGIASDEWPRLVVPSIVASSRADETQYIAGWEAATAQLDPQKWRVAQAFDAMDPDWDAALSMWEHCFSQLGVGSDERSVMMTETPDMSSQGREEALEIFFEYFNVPSMYIGNSALMSLYGVGMLNGLVLELGQRLQIVPVNSGAVEQHAVQQLKKGITNLHSHLAELLEERGYFFQSAADLELVRRAKERCAYVAADINAELARPEEDIVTTYTDVRSGRHVELGKERFLCSELLFAPERSGQLDASFGLHRLVYDTVMKCPIDTRLNLLNHIVLVGGGTLLPGFASRLENEVWQIMSEEKQMRGLRRNNIRCISRPNRKYLAWKGAATFANMATFDELAASRDDYDEQGKERLALERMYS